MTPIDGMQSCPTDRRPGGAILPPLGGAIFRHRAGGAILPPIYSKGVEGERLLRVAARLRLSETVCGGGETGQHILEHGAQEHHSERAQAGTRNPCLHLVPSTLKRTLIAPTSCGTNSARTQLPSGRKVPDVASRFGARPETRYSQGIGRGSNGYGNRSAVPASSVDWRLLALLALVLTALVLAPKGAPEPADDGREALPSTCGQSTHRPHLFGGVAGVLSPSRMPPRLSGRGLRLSARRAFRAARPLTQGAIALLKAGPGDLSFGSATSGKWSNSKVARACAVDEGTVRRHRSTIIGNSEDATAPVLVERNGTTYEMGTTNIGPGEVRA
jgi:hypothetical protein